MRQPAEHRRSQIVEATLRLMVERGPDRVTTQAIADAVGLTQPALFRHFPRKLDIWMAVLDWLIGETAESRWPQALAQPLPPLARLRALIATQLELIAHTPAVPALLFSRELHVENEALRSGLAGLMGRFIGHIRTLLEEALAANALRPGLDIALAAKAVATVPAGTALRWSLSGHRFDIVAEGLESFDVLLQGIAP